jgi:hypothetical protein
MRPTLQLVGCETYHYSPRNAYQLLSVVIVRVRTRDYDGLFEVDGCSIL